MSVTVPKSRARYALGVLFIVYAISLVDRQILAMLLEDIKLDMGLRDWQLGFLSGISFALFYSTAGIPLARLADRSSRRTVISAGMVAWSIATAFSGAAQSFWQLALARVAVGVGEAAGSPPSHSLISDLFPPETRARAIAVYTMGANFGVMGGLMLGGWLSQTIGWRWTFVAVGLPGILFAVLVRFTLSHNGVPSRSESMTLRSHPWVKHCVTCFGSGRTVSWPPRLRSTMWLPTASCSGCPRSCSEYMRWTGSRLVCGSVRLPVS